MREILTIIPYKITNNELYNLKEELRDEPNIRLYKFLPEFSISDTYGNLLPTEYYHQFTGSVKDETCEVFYLLDIHSASPVLEEEISQCGIEEIFNKYDWRHLFNSIPNGNINKFDKILIPTPLHMVLEVIYTGEYEDVEVEFKPVGYLDDDLKLIYCCN